MNYTFFSKYKRCIAVFVVMQAISFSLILYDRDVQKETFYNSLKASYSAKLSLKGELIAQTFTPLFSDVRFLSSQRSLTAYFRNPNNNKDLISDFKIFLSSNPSYDQVRVLNLNGKEIIRVNIGTDSAYNVIENELQDKSKRDYFAKSIFLNENEIYLSSLDLNMENGKIELPEKATIRIVTPVFHIGEKKGLLVINYNANRFLHQLSLYNNSKSTFLLVNNTGSILSGPPEFKKFAMLKEDSKEDLSFYFPQLGKALRKNKNGFLKNKNGFFVFKTVNLYNHSDYNLYKNRVNLSKGEKDWFIIYCLDKKSINQNLKPVDINCYLFMLFATIINICISVAFYYLRNREISYVEQLKFLNENLEESIVKRTKQLSQTKVLLEEKVKALTSSIRYAKKVQETILPQKKMIKGYFPNSFILYMPKDIVAGDFYWMEPFQEVNNPNQELIIFAVADCTGHGVPGAMASMVCFNALNKVVKQERIYQPSVILDHVALLVEEAFCQGEDALSDGMDVSLCCLNLKTNVLQWSGANNPLWIIRISEDKSELIEYKADRQAIGKLEGHRKKFTNHEIQLKKGDLVYLFSDGLQDQFNGITNQKLKKVGLKELMKKVSKIENMNEQREYLRGFIREWKGDSMQIDDICIVGLKL